MGQAAETKPTERPPAPGQLGWRALPVAACAALLASTGLVALAFVPVAETGLSPLFWAIVLGAVALAAQVFVLVYMLRTHKPLRMIHGAVGSWSHGEATLELLKVADDGSRLAENWNRLITAWVASQKALRGVRAASKSAAAAAPEVGRSPIFDLLPQGLLMIDAAGKVRSANGAGGRMLMRSAERLADAPLDALIHDGTLHTLVASCLRDAKPRGGTAEITLSHGEGPDAVLRCTVRPLGSAEDRQALVIMEDITHQRLADQARNHFVAQATHELRTPLTNIGLYVERAIDLSDAEVAERSECLNVINSEVGRLSRVVEEFLSVSEIESGSLQVRRDDVRVDELVARMQEEYAPQAQAKPVTLTFDLPPKLSVMQGDREKVSLALHNLIGNAIKYTPAGKQVRVELGEEDGWVEVRVSDTGIGIGPEDLPKVFEKFYRAKDERLAGIKGSGLGLALAREVIRMHGGDITAESTLNQGSTFTLRLPLRHPAESSGAAAGPASPALTRKP